MSDRSRTPAERRSTARPGRRSEDELRFRLLSAMSDELRTPIVAILGFANVLLEDEPEGGRRRSLGAIRRHAEHLLLMVDDLLDLARLERGKLEVVPVEADLRLVIEASVGIARARARESPVTLELELDPDLPERARFDATRVRQALGHLVENALKFTGQGQVYVRAGFQAPRTAWIEVEDSGPGLTPEDYERLSVPFSPGGDPLARRFKGLGVGLALARGIAASLGGALRCSTSGKLGGAAFRFEFDAEPLAPLPDARPAPRRAWLQGRVLVAEDSPDVQRLLRHFLESAGLEVETVADGGAAIDRALEGDFDLVLMDLQMPLVDGFTAARELRRRGFERPILALTANTAPNCRELSRAAGCDAFAPKPIDRMTLLGLVARHLAEAKAGSL
jgi:CheY-like chemotaxis protein